MGLINTGKSIQWNAVYIAPEILLYRSACIAMELYFAIVQ